MKGESGTPQRSLRLCRRKHPLINNQATLLRSISPPGKGETHASSTTNRHRRRPR